MMSRFLGKRRRHALRAIVCISVLLLACGGATIAQEIPSQPTSTLESLNERLKSGDENVRLEAVTEIAATQPRGSFSLLFQVLKDPSPHVRRKVVEAFTSFKGDRAVDGLRRMRNDEDAIVRGAVAWSLSRIGGKEVLPDIIELAQKDPAAIVRFRAVWGLAIIGDKSALPVAIDALGDPNNSVRERAALLALEALNDGSIPKRLLEKTSHPHLGTRRLVMYLLARYGDESAVPALKEGLKDVDTLVRAEAALSLGKLRAHGALDALVPLLYETDEHVRGAAAYAIGLIGDNSATPLLRPLLEDKNAFVRAVAAESLQRLGDKTASPPEGFHAAEIFTFPIHSPEHRDLYR
jgi:HEAT repeat protein